MDLSSQWMEKKRRKVLYLAFQLNLLFVGIRGVPLCQTSLALSILDEDE